MQRATQGHSQWHQHASCQIHWQALQHAEAAAKTTKQPRLLHRWALTGHGSPQQPTDAEQQSQQVLTSPQGASAAEAAQQPLSTNSPTWVTTIRARPQIMNPTTLRLRTTPCLNPGVFRSRGAGWDPSSTGFWPSDPWTLNPAPKTPDAHAGSQNPGATVMCSEPGVPGWVHPAECLAVCCCLSQLQCLLVDLTGGHLLLTYLQGRKVLQTLNHLHGWTHIALTRAS